MRYVQISFITSVVMSLLAMLLAHHQYLYPMAVVLSRFSMIACIIGFTFLLCEVIEKYRKK
jgi:hypothetical protein